jgi:carboxyl-terminal processing protease
MIRRFSFLLAGVAIGALATVAVTQGQFLSSTKAIAASSDAYRELNLFGDVFERVRADYVEVPDDNQLVESAINGMLAGLDPHSSYMNAKDYKDMQVTTTGKFGGLGIQVTMEDGIIKVISPMDGTPAAKAGILANDKIIALDGEQLTGVTLDAAVEKMRGDVGTPITLTILRGGDDKKPFDVKLIRAEIVVEAVTGRAEGQVIYVRIASFSENAFDGLKSQIDKLSAQIGADKVQGIIVDLRNDPGGLLDQAIAVSDAFLNEGEVVSTRGRRASTPTPATSPRASR